MLFSSTRLCRSFIDVNRSEFRDVESRFCGGDIDRAQSETRPEQLRGDWVKVEPVTIVDSVKVVHPFAPRAAANLSLKGDRC